MSSKIIEKQRNQESMNDASEELDEYQFERHDDLELPTVTHSVVDISQPAQNQKEEKETAYILLTD